MHLDLCIGQITLDRGICYLAFQPSASLKAADPLNFAGYAGSYYTDAVQQQAAISEEPQINVIGLDDLWAEVENDEGDSSETEEEFNDPLLFATDDEEENNGTPEAPATEINHSEPEPVTDELKWENEIAHLKYSEITGVFQNACFEKIFDYLPVDGVFTNGFRFELTNSDIEPSGVQWWADHKQRKSCWNAHYKKRRNNIRIYHGAIKSPEDTVSSE